MKEMEINPQDREALIREKYGDNREAEGLAGDLERLATGEPLAYVIGHIPFLGVKVWLDSRPLVPRPETEWWTEELIKKINTRSEPNDPTETGTMIRVEEERASTLAPLSPERGVISLQENDMIYHSTSAPLHVLDVCAGSGAIGLAVLKHCTGAQVTFSEIANEHAQLIQKNIRVNHLDAARAAIHVGDLFEPFSASEQFDIIATNPPYIPETRTLPESVTHFEPREALYAGSDGLRLIRSIVNDARRHLRTGGELWMECDISNIREAKYLAQEAGYSHVEIRTDLYGRERLLVAQL